MDLKAVSRMIGNDIDKVIIALIDRVNFILRKAVQNFEIAFAKYCGTNSAIGSGGGIETLHFAMRVLAIRIAALWMRSGDVDDI